MKAIHFGGCQMPKFHNMTDLDIGGYAGLGVVLGNVANIARELTTSRNSCVQ